MAEDQRRLITCRICGGEFLGWPSRKLCPDCAAGRQQDDSPERELADEKDGWRHMFRDATGTVIVPGGNVMSCLDDLCAYEEACEAAGIHGPEELRKALDLQKRGTTSSGPAGHLPLKGEALERNADGEIVYSCRFCGSCGHFVRESENRGGTAGHCDAHPRMRRSEGGRKGKLMPVPGEFRHVAGAREACRKWTQRIDTPAQPSPSAPHYQEEEGSGRAPEWVGPSAELLPEETQAAGRKEKTADKQCLSLQSESGGNS